MTQELRRKQVEEILSKVITRETHKGTHARVVIQSAGRILALLSDAERKGAWAVSKALENLYDRWPRTVVMPPDKSTVLDAARQVASSFGPDPEGEGEKV